MLGVWSVARSTFSHCLRMKSAGVLLIVLAVVLAALPFVMTGDGTLAGRVRTFLAYGIGLTATLLSVTTILLATSVVSGDIEDKFVFTLAVKPLARWQYVLGRWLGMVLLNAVLLSAATLFIWVMAVHLRDAGQVLNPEDRRAVETEVLTARGKAQAEWPFDFDQRLKKLIEQAKAAGRYDEALSEYVKKHRGDRKRAAAALIKEYANALVMDLQSVPPGGVAAWKFTGVKVDDRPRRAECRPTDWDLRPGAQWMRFQAPSDLTARLVYDGPVIIGGVRARVRQVRDESFVAKFDFEDVRRGRLKEFKRDTPVSVTVKPTVQFSYELSFSGGRSDKTVPCLWKITNPQTGAYVRRDRYYEQAQIPTTLVVPAAVVSDAGDVRVAFTNSSRDEVISIARKDLAVLYRIGGFEMNLAKGALLVFRRLVFLSALGVLLGCFLSFPVASFVALVLMMISLGATFLAEATQLPASFLSAADWFSAIGHYAMIVVLPVAPDFSNTSAVDALVNGTYIYWGDLARVAAVSLFGHSLVVLAVACLVYRFRELARVQV